MHSLLLQLNEHLIQIGHVYAENYTTILGCKANVCKLIKLNMLQLISTFLYTSLNLRKGVQLTTLSPTYKYINPKNYMFYMFHEFFVLIL